MFPGELNGAFLFVQDLVRLVPGQVFPLGSRSTVADTAAVIARHRIDAVVAGPAYGTELVTTACPEQLTSLRAFLYLGEALTDDRLQAVEAAIPGITVRSLAYSTSETGPIGYQCDRLTGSAHHVHEDAVLVEVVDEHTGDPVLDGMLGEVAVTPFLTSGMALFRYRVGDRASFSPEPCPCGSSARVITLVGRTAQSLTVDVWTISSDQLMAVLGELGVTDPADCQLQVLWSFPRYEVRLLLSPRTPPGINADALLQRVGDQYQLARVLTSPRCTAVSVHRVDAATFARSGRDKVPVLYQRFDHEERTPSP
jgi:phenylacetate-CoA ligase